MKRALRPSIVKTVVTASVMASMGVVPGGARADPPPARPAACPATAPARDAVCSQVGLTCGYNDCMGHWTFIATCAGSPARWMVTEATCNPPAPPSANPPAMPPRVVPLPPIHRNPPPPNRRPPRRPPVHNPPSP